MSRCYATIKGEVINPKEIILPSGKKITDFAIKIDTNDFKTKEWNTSFLNCKLIGDYELETKKIYEFKGSLDSDKYTKKDGEEVSQIILTAFECVEGDNEGREQNKIKEKPQVEEPEESDIPF